MGLNGFEETADEEGRERPTSNVQRSTLKVRWPVLPEEMSMPADVALSYASHRMPNTRYLGWCLRLGLILAGLGLSVFAEPAAVEFPHWRVYTRGGRFATSVAPDGRGGFWCGAEGRGLWHFDELWWTEVRLPEAYEYPLAIVPGRTGTCFGLSRSGAAVLREAADHSESAKVSPDPSVGESAQDRWTFHNIWNGLAAHRVYAAFWEESAPPGGEGSNAEARRRKGEQGEPRPHTPVPPHPQTPKLPYSRAPALPLPHSHTPTRRHSTSPVLWLGTDTGLWRWDGTWRNCQSAVEAEYGSVTCVAKWQGKIIAGTELRGVWRLAEDGLRPLGPEGLPDRRVHDLAVDPGGRLWAATFGGAAVLGREAVQANTEADGDAIAWERVPLPLKERTEAEDKVALSPQSQAVLCLGTDNVGSIWMGTRTEGVYRYFPEGRTWQHFGRAEGLPDIFVRDLFVCPTGSVWVATYGGGVAGFERPKFRLEADNFTLDYADSTVACSKGWAYNDREVATSLQHFIYGRRLRKAQCDGPEKHVCLYFDGPERVKTTGSAGTSVPLSEVLLIGTENGQILWRAPGIPRRPVRWSPDAGLVARQPSDGEMCIDRPGDGRAWSAQVPETVRVEDLFFIDEQTLGVLASRKGEGGRPGSQQNLLATWRAGAEEEIVLQFHATESVPEAIDAPQDLRRAAIAGRQAEVRGSPPPASQLASPAHASAARRLLEAMSCQVVGKGAEEIRLKAGGSTSLDVPDGMEGPFGLVLFEYARGSAQDGDGARPTEPLSPEQSAKVFVGPESGRAEYVLDEAAERPRPVFVCVPTGPDAARAIQIQAFPDRPMVLRNIRWLRLRKAGTPVKPTTVSDRGDELIKVQFHLISPRLFIRDVDGAGAAAEAPFSKETSARLFDGNTQVPLWPRTEGLLGWTMLIDFPEPVVFEGLMALGTPGRLSEQAEGLLLETMAGSTGKWERFGAVSGPPQFQHAIFGEKVATRVRITSLCRNAVLSELLVFARPHEGEVEDEGFDEIEDDR